ncbi:mitochondrial ribosomal protein L9 [Dermatophagoides pteronyssinus]|uniref:Large ribosomal subunit protein bL9m n=1 Tax=Dermatophagoides pteronyssinus TaxID=6956 RepID=A0ABQ8JRN0_DERPT|nr:54S ribosomal protein L9, mitochondrial [Dermatophagoides pteronyssinus]KAH9425043.1 54S ribosomal protein L9, mitochondrial [Dermatophagoides pteronyssinus]
MFHQLIPHLGTNLLIKCSCNQVSRRSVVILKRKVRLPSQPSLISPLIVGPFLKDRPHFREPRPVADFIYEEVEDSEKIEESKLKLILLETVDEIGVPGDIVEVERDYGRFSLLSSNRAVYASPYNLNKFKQLIEAGSKDRVGPSSAFVGPTLKKLANDVIIVVMNDEHPWTLKPCHVRIGLRAAGYLVPEECIRLPDTPINGPDIEGKQGKDFAVTVTINNRETVNVRCLLHHKGHTLRLNWNRKPRHILLDEQKELLESMPCKDALEEDEYNLVNES